MSRYLCTKTSRETECKTLFKKFKQQLNMAQQSNLQPDASGPNATRDHWSEIKQFLDKFTESTERYHRHMEAQSIRIPRYALEITFTEWAEEVCRILQGRYSLKDEEVISHMTRHLEGIVGAIAEVAKKEYPNDLPKFITYIDEQISLNANYTNHSTLSLRQQDVEKEDIILYLYTKLRAIKREAYLADDNKAAIAILVSGMKPRYLVKCRERIEANKINNFKELADLCQKIRSKDPEVASLTGNRKVTFKPRANYSYNYYSESNEAEQLDREIAALSQPASILQKPVDQRVKANYPRDFSPYRDNYNKTRNQTYNNQTYNHQYRNNNSHPGDNQPHNNTHPNNKSQQNNHYNHQPYNNTHQNNNSQQNNHYHNRQSGSSNNTGRNSHTYNNNHPNNNNNNYRRQYNSQPQNQEQYQPNQYNQNSQQQISNNLNNNQEGPIAQIR